MRVTLIGAFRCPDGVVLFADRQETIADYAKWDADKIKHLELHDCFRLLMTGSGDSDTLEMVWEEFLKQWKINKPEQPSDIKALIARVVSRITKRSILPYPRDDRPWIRTIWALQRLPSSSKNHGFGIELFRTAGLVVLDIDTHYETGSPVFLMRYLTDLYIRGTVFGVEEGEALASYLLWEAKEYDPNCGKHGDIVILRNDGKIGRVTRQEEQYWEEHFLHFKNSLRIMPLLTCASSLTQPIYNSKDHMARFITMLKTLAREQQAMRSKQRKGRLSLEDKLMRNLRKTAARFSKPSASQKLKPKP
ncbi:MAG: hypothetical protein HY651_03115 [Acidobacteria bacterium]|nr:hypothetical protein [Acidobacteriota bacterium]